MRRFRLNRPVNKNKSTNSSHASMPLRGSTAVVVIPKHFSNHAQKRISISSRAPPPLSSITPTSNIPEFDPITNFMDKTWIIENDATEDSKSCEVLNKIESINNKLISEYVNRHVFENMQDLYAFKIQRTFRNYKNKKFWKTFIRLRLSSNRRLCSLFLFSWRLATTNKIRTLIVYHKKFEKSFTSMLFVQRRRVFSPFQLFYISNQLFIPNGFDPHNIYSYVYLMYSTMIRRIFRLWNHVTNKIKEHRHSLQFIRYTVTKISKFGLVYTGIVCWSRFVKWKKLAKSMGQNNTSNYITIDSVESNPHWKAFESQLNFKRRRVEIANNYSIKRIARKAVRALFNVTVQSMTEIVALEQGDVFYNRHLQTQAHKAWMKYMELIQQRRQILKDYINAWYEHSYSAARVKALVDFYNQRRFNILLRKILSKWNYISNVQRVKTLGHQLMIQRRTSLALLVIFLLQGKMDNFFHILCWIYWSRFLMARNNWKLFVNFSESVDKNRDFSHQVIIGLKHIVHSKKIGKVLDPDAEFIPRKLGFCIETCLNKVEANKNYLAKRSTQGWSGSILPGPIPVREPGKESLIRALVLRLHKIRSFQTYERSLRKNTHPLTQQQSGFDVTSLISEDELRIMMDQNSLILKQNLSRKLIHDSVLLATLRAHSQALEFSNYIQGFTTMCDPKSIEINPLELSEKKLTLPSNISDVIMAHIRSFDISPQQFDSNFKDDLAQHIEKFEERLREPSYAKKSAASMLGRTINSFSPANAVRNQTLNNPRIIQYKGKKKQGSMRLGSVRSFNKDATFINTRQGDRLKFTTEQLVKSLGLYYTSNDGINTLYKYLMTATNHRVNPKAIIKATDKSRIPDSAPQTDRRRVVRNSTKLVDQINGLTLSNDEAAETLGEAIVSTCFTLYHSLKGTHFEVYLEKLPFFEADSISSESIVDARMRLWNASKKKFPKIDVPASDNALGRLSLRTSANSSTNNLRSSSVNFNQFNEHETLNGKDVYITCLILPYVFSLDALTEFIRDELLNAQGEKDQTMW